MVEMGGIEPPSESTLTATSPGADGLLYFPRPGASRHAPGFGSFMMRGTVKAFRTHGNR